MIKIRALSSNVRLLTNLKKHEKYSKYELFKFLLLTMDNLKKLSKFFAMSESKTLSGNIAAHTWKTLRDRAFSKKVAAELLAGHDQFEEAMESWHMACELIIKSALVKHGCTPKADHDLQKLVNKRYKGKKLILNSIRSNANAIKAFSAVQTAWNVSMRYNGYNYKAIEIEDFLNSYEVLFLWIENNLMS